jgi:endonuclease/exonuclease/phosphatase family metal-dependent hydrolase
LDGVYVRGDLELEGVERSREAVARAASDHLPLLAELCLT